MIWALNCEYVLSTICIHIKNHKSNTRKHKCNINNNKKHFRKQFTASYNMKFNMMNDFCLNNLLANIQKKIIEIIYKQKKCHSEFMPLAVRSEESDFHTIDSSVALLLQNDIIIINYIILRFFWLLNRIFFLQLLTLRMFFLVMLNPKLRS